MHDHSPLALQSATGLPRIRTSTSLREDHSDRPGIPNQTLNLNPRPNYIIKFNTRTGDSATAWGLIHAILEQFIYSIYISNYNIIMVTRPN